MNLKLKHLLQEAMKASITLVEKHSNVIVRYSSLKEAINNDNELSKEFKNELKKFIILLPEKDINYIIDFFNLDIGYFDSFQRLIKEDEEEEKYVAIPLCNDIGILELGYFDLLDNNILSFVPEKYLNGMSKDTKYDFLEKWEHYTNFKRVVITHAKCNDGASVAAVVKHHRDTILKDNNVDDEIEFIYLDYNAYNIDDLISKVKDKLVYIGDFSFPISQYRDLMLAAEEIVLVDHHKGAMEDIDLANHYSVHIDLTKSGGVLTKDFFLGVESDIDYVVIDLIGDRDLWNWFYGSYSEAMAMMIKKEGHEVISKYLGTNMSRCNRDLFEDLEPYKKEAIKQDLKYIDKANEAEEYEVYGIKFFGLNLTVGPSEILNHVSRLNNTPSLSYSFKDNVMTFSFRNYKDDIDVNLIANMFGGGGHTQASGAKVNVSNICLEDFFLDKKLVVKYIVDDEASIKLFDYYGVDPTWVKNSKHCEVITEALNKPFNEVFKVTRDNKENLVLKVK